MADIQEVMKVAREGSVPDIEGMHEEPGAISNAFTSAVGASNWPIVEFLVPKLDNLNNALISVAGTGQARVVELLLTAGASADGHDDGEPLGMVCVHGKSEREEEYLAVLKLLLDAGANPNLYKGSRDFSCLLYIANHGWSGQAATLLLDAGADLYAVDGRSRTALDLIWGSYAGNDKTAVQAVIEAAFEADND